MRTRIGVTTLALLAALLPGPALTQEETQSMIGVLQLPAVFGVDGCGPRHATPVPVYAGADTDTRLGEIHVTGEAPDGNCPSRDVGLRLTAGGDSKLPTVEHGYELRSVIVRRIVADRFEIALPGTTGWVRARDAGEYVPVLRLLEDQLLYLTPHAPARGDVAGRQPPVEIVGSEEVDGRLLLHLHVLPEQPCNGERVEGGDAAITVPFHGEGGLPSVWFHSRGC